MSQTGEVNAGMGGLTADLTYSKVVTLVAEILAIGSAIGAICSILLNTFRFNHWGLSFTDVADASDILMSGLSVGIDLAKLLVFLTLGCLISEALLAFSARVLRPRKVVPVAPLVIAVAAAIGALVHSFSVLAKYRQNESSVLSARDLIILGLCGGAIFGSLFISRWRVFKNNRYLFWVVLFMIVSTSALISVKDLDNTADHAEFRWLSADNFCIGAPTVVWMGGSSLVAKCATSDRTWTYIIRDRNQGVIGHRRAVVRFVRSQRSALYRPLIGETPHDWALAANVKAPIYVDRSSIKMQNGEAQFVAAYFPQFDPAKPPELAGTSVQISDQLTRCVFPYSGRLVNLLAFSRSERRIRLDETSEDNRYDTTIARYNYDLAQFVCENIGSRQAIDPAKAQVLGDIFSEGSKVIAKGADRPATISSRR